MFVLNTLHSVYQDKIRAAKEILATLRSQRASQIQDMEHLAHFYISLAYHITESQRFTRGNSSQVFTYTVYWRHVLVVISCSQLYMTSQRTLVMTVAALGISYNTVLTILLIFFS